MHLYFTRARQVLCSTDMGRGTFFGHVGLANGFFPPNNGILSRRAIE